MSRKLCTGDWVRRIVVASGAFDPDVREGEQGDMSEKGNPGPAQTQVFASSVKVDTVVKHAVNCPPNWFVTGGGYSIDGGDLTIGMSKPDTDSTPPRYWEVAAANNQREPGGMTVFVVCAPGA